MLAWSSSLPSLILKSGSVEGSELSDSPRDIFDRSFATDLSSTSQEVTVQGISAAKFDEVVGAGFLVPQDLYLTTLVKADLVKTMDSLATTPWTDSTGEIFTSPVVPTGDTLQRTVKFKINVAVFGPVVVGVKQVIRRQAPGIVEVAMESRSQFKEKNPFSTFEGFRFRFENDELIVSHHITKRPLRTARQLCPFFEAIGLDPAPGNELNGFFRSCVSGIGKQT